MTSETPAGAPPAPGHTAQLFDDEASLVATVGGYLADGWHRGDALLVVSTDHHWVALQRRLDGLGVPVGDAVASGRLVVRDAHTLLTLLYRRQRIDREQFDAWVARLVGELAAGGARVRVFGEMVDLLAGAGDFDDAEQLEGLWNDLAARQPFRLLCAYSATAFGDPRSREALRRICGAHADVHTDPADLLGTFLVERAQTH
jgi:hypothetical protein